MEYIENKNKKLNINNIKGIIKYSFLSLKVTYIVEAVIIGLSFLLNFFIGKYSAGMELMGCISICFVINLIACLVLFAKQLSKEYGRLLFLTPINSAEFLLGNLLHFIGVNLIIAVVSILLAALNAQLLPELLIITTLSVYFAFIVAYLILSAAITIASVYIPGTGLRVFVILLAFVFGQGIYDRLLKVALKIFPYIYVSVTGWADIKLDVFEIIINLLALFGLQYLAAKCIDKKLDIA